MNQSEGFFFQTSVHQALLLIKPIIRLIVAWNWREDGLYVGFLDKCPTDKQEIAVTLGKDVLLQRYLKGLSN